VIALELAVRLRDAGLEWTPASGDRFAVADRDLDDEVFVLSQMTIEVRGSLIAFNGTTEWALDDLERDEAIWLPAEDQLRERLGESFYRLERVDDGYRVVATVDGRAVGFDAPTPVEAYALAVLRALTTTDRRVSPTRHGE
jgi:hypothetical protein